MLMGNQQSAFSQNHQDDCDRLRAYRYDDDERAFTELVQRHLDLVYGVAYGALRDRHLAEDVSQRVFTVLARKGKRQEIRHVSSWLFGTTQREVKTMMRSECRRRKREQEAFEREVLATNLVHECQGEQEMSRVVATAMQALPEKDQQALFLRFYEGHAFGEMGTILGLGERAAQKRVYRAMERLRVLLNKRGITATATVFSGTWLTAGAEPAPVGLASSVSREALAQGAVRTSGMTMVESLRLFTQPIMLLAVMGASLGVVAWKSSTHVRIGDVSVSRAEVRDSDRIDRQNLLEGLERAEVRLAVDDIEGIYRLAVNPREVALRRLLGHLSQPHEDAYLRDLFMRWSALDASRCAEAIVAIERWLPNESTSREAFMQIALQEWWKREKAGVEAWVRALPRTDRGEQMAFGALVAIVAEEDPMRGFGLVSQRGGTGDRHYHTLAEGFVRLGVPHAIALLGELTPSEEAVTVRSHRDERVTFTDDEAAPLRRLYAALLPRFFAWDRQATADWVMETDETEITVAFVSQWAAIDPAQASAWALRLSLEESDQALCAAIASWSAHDVEGAMQWISPHVVEPRAAQAFGGFAEVIGHRQAVEWAHQLVPGPGRERLLQHAFFQLGAQESPEVLEGLLEALPSDVKAAATTAAAKGVFVGQGLAILQRWRQHAGPNLVRDLLLGETDVLASLNPKRAARVLLAEQPSGAMDAAWEVLMRRTYERDGGGRGLARSWVAAISDPRRRHTWEERLRGPAPTVVRALPQALEKGFGTQSWSEFEERLDLLATFPLRDDGTQ